MAHKPGGMPKTHCCLDVGCAGQELQQDSATLQSYPLRNRATLNAMESPEPNKITKAPSEYRPQFELTSVTWILSQTVSSQAKAPTVRWRWMHATSLGGCGSAALLVMSA